jgi:spoOJ protein
MAVHKKYNSSNKGFALGRGLDALISTDEVKPQGSSTINEVLLSEIEANPNQPRREFDQEALQELANSIKEIGIIQPITLHQVAENKYQIIAGERRWRASQLAGLTAIPAYIRTIKDASVMEMALVENIQREDLNAIEIALAYEQLVAQSGMTQEKVAERVGKSRTAVTNYMRLLRLPAQVQMALQKKSIDMGHARALLSIDSPSLQIKLFNEIQKNGYSVRKVEELVQNIKSGESFVEAKKKVKTTTALPEEFNVLKQQLSKFLNTKVQMNYSAKGKGKISIPFANTAELEHIMQVFDKLKE